MNRPNFLQTLRHGWKPQDPIGGIAQLDLAEVKKRMTTPIVFDGRNLLKPETMAELGFHYHSIGRASAKPQ